MVNCSLTRDIILIVIEEDLGSFAISIIVVFFLTQRNVRARRGFREDLKE